MELIALAVVFALVYFPLFLATELLGGHPEPRRNAFPVDAATAAERWLAAHPRPGRVPAKAANDDDARLVA